MLIVWGTMWLSSGGAELVTCHEGGMVGGSKESVVLHEMQRTRDQLC